MSIRQETIGGAKVDQGTQYEDLTQLEDICCNHNLESVEQEVDAVPVREETIGGADLDKGTQCEDTSGVCPCNFVLETIEEENTITTESISNLDSEDSEDEEFRRQEKICEQNQQPEYPVLDSKYPENQVVDSEHTCDEEQHYTRHRFQNNQDDCYFVNKSENEADLENCDLHLEVFVDEDDGCIIDKLERIEELSEVDSLESFSTYEYEVSRDVEILRERGNVTDLSNDFQQETCRSPCIGDSNNKDLSPSVAVAIDRGESSVKVSRDINNKDLSASVAVAIDRGESSVEVSRDIAWKKIEFITEIAFVNSPIKEPYLSVESDHKDSLCVEENICYYKAKTEIRRDNTGVDCLKSRTMECGEVMSPLGETRLPPEGAKTEPVNNDLDADDTHSVDSLEMIETEKPPWKLSEEQETTSVSPSAQKEQNLHADEKGDSVSQSGSSVTDSLESDQALVNGSRRSLSSTSDDGGATPFKKESKLPIFIDKHPKFKGSNIPKPKSIRPQPISASPHIPNSNKATPDASPSASTTNLIKEHSTCDVIAEKPKSRASSVSPMQRRKSATGCDVVKEKTQKPPSRQRQQTIDLGDARLNKEPSIEPRDTLASRKRIAAIHNVETKELSDDYLTPFQRKEQSIKELRQDLKDIQKDLAERDVQLQLFNVEKDRDMTLLSNEKDETISDLTKNYERLLESFTELQSSHEDVLRLANDLELNVHSLKEETTMREARHQEMYLEMYNKGKDSAKFERLDELEKIAKEEPDKVTVAELLEKLKTTETELGYWQSLKRQDIYAQSEKPETEAAATLRFLKDSMFHYVTDPKDSESHFRAMIQIFGYTPVQMRNMEKIMSGDKKPKKTFTKSKSVERKSSK